MRAVKFRFMVSGEASARSLPNVLFCTQFQQNYVDQDWRTFKGASPNCL